MDAARAALFSSHRGESWFRSKAGGRLLCASAVIFAVLLALAAWIVQEVLPFALIRPSRAERNVLYSGFTPQTFGLRAEDMWVETEPGLWLRGWFIHALAAGDGKTLGTVLLLHGSSSCKESMLGAARLFAEGGFNSLAFDMRAHGESGGMYRTFGYYERTDCSCLINESKRRFGPLGPIAVYGNSMGGAIALQTMASDPRIRCGIVESSFATLREIARDYMHQYAGVSFQWVATLALKRAENLAKFSVDDVRPETAACRIERPVLLVHGTLDQNVSIHYGERIFRNLRAPGCEWDPVTGGNHGNLWKIGGTEYRRKLLSFMQKYDN